MLLSEEERSQLKEFLRGMNELEKEERRELLSYMEELLDKNKRENVLESNRELTRCHQSIRETVERLTYHQLLAVLFRYQKNQRVKEITLQDTIEEARAKKNMVAKVEQEQQIQKK